MAKIINLPKPTDQEGNILSVEEVQTLAEEPYYVEIYFPLGSKVGKFFLAADFDNVDRDSKRNYDRFKQAQFTKFADKRPKRKNGKLTHLAKMQDEAEEEANMDSFNDMMDAVYDNADILIGIMFPKDYASNPVILGHNLPGIPTEQDELKNYLKAGSTKAWIIIESVIAAFDPTSALAINQKTRKLMESAEQEMVKAVETMETAVEPMEQTEENLELPLGESQEMEAQPSPNSLSTTTLEGESVTEETVNLSEAELQIELRLLEQTAQMEPQSEPEISPWEKAEMAIQDAMESEKS